MKVTIRVKTFKDLPDGTRFATPLGDDSIKLATPTKGPNTYNIGHRSFHRLNDGARVYTEDPESTLVPVGTLEPGEPFVRDSVAYIKGGCLTGVVTATRIDDGWIVSIGEHEKVHRARGEAELRYF